MNRTRWLILAALASILLVCACLGCSGLAGVLYLRAEPAAYTIEAHLPPQGPTRTPTLVQRESTSIEEQTAETVMASTLPSRDLQDLARRLQVQSHEPAAASGTPAAQCDLGDRQPFWLHDVQTNTSYTSTATLQYITPHSYWWVEDGYSLPARDLKRSALRFEEHTYPNNRRLFGSEWTPGIDGDPHVYIYLGNLPGVGGYFSGPDEYPVEVRPESNQHEMFYVNLDNAMPGSDYFDGVLAHEFQHMIHWAMDRDETTWVNEGLSELAGLVNGYEPGDSASLYSDFPDTQLTSWPDPQDAGPNYGASYLFLTYFWERYGEEGVRSLVAEPANGIAGFEATLSELGAGTDGFGPIFANWVVANYLDGLSEGSGRFDYRALSLEPMAHAAEHSDYPVNETAEVQQYAADYILLEGEGTLTIDFTGSQVVPLVGNQTHSGDYQWWSNRGDEGDATLTRAFDLSDLEQATLHTWMWYDLELDYDYAYVEVSADGGQSWTLLANEHTTTTNPSGNGYGPALTGISGGGDEPEWAEEAFDLSGFAGQEVLVRFEVVTDESVHRPGLCLDDLSIPELQFADSVEGGSNGWQAEGWLRVTDQVPQAFLVQLITFGSGTAVEQVVLDGQMRGSVEVGGLGSSAERAVLVVSGVARGTTEPATYGYRIRQE